MSSLWVETAAALRTLRRAPAFTALAVALLSLGIGANVAIFSIFQSIILSPLPYPEPMRLVGFTAINSAKALTMPALSASDFRDFHQRATSFERLAAFRPDFFSYVPANGGDPLQLVGAHVTVDFFSTFGVAPFAGRPFRAEEFSFSAPRSAVLSYSAWRRVFGAQANIVGATVTLNDVPTTIVGVMPDGFREPEFVDVWLPFPDESPEYFARDSRFWTTVGRLKRDSSLGAAQAEARTIASALATEFPATNKGWSASVQPLLELRVSDLRQTLLLLVGAVGLVLLIACVNLANLMLARGVGRLQELAVRLALGSTPGTLARTVFLESLILSLAGGAAGVALAALFLPVLASQLPAGLIPRSHEISVDGAALLFALGTSTATGVIFGLLPAWQVLRTNVNEALKSGGRAGTSRFARRVQAALIAGQAALTLVVLFGAALLMRSMINLQQTDPGFDPRHVLTTRLAPPPAKWETLLDLAAYYERALDEVRRVPGVEAAAVNSSAPLSGLTLRYPFWVEGRPRADGNADDAVFNSISTDFFRTLRIPLLSGRLLDERDTEQSLRVCVINQSLATRLFPGESALGKRIQTLPWLTREYREIVGVVADVKQENLSDPPPPQIYVPLRQSPWFFATLVVRRQGESVSAAALQAALRRADPTAPTTISTLESSIGQTAALPRLRTTLFGLFGLVALGLSSFGIYASMAFTVNQRLREIGVRMALGATPQRIVAEVLIRGGQLALAGIAMGLFGAVALAQLLRGLLHGVQPGDPLTLAALAGFLLIVALAASAVPALRAARLNPVHALQQE